MSYGMLNVSFKMYKRFIGKASSCFHKRSKMVCRAVKRPVTLNKGHFVSSSEGSALTHEHVNYSGGKVNAGS